MTNGINAAVAAGLAVAFTVAVGFIYGWHTVGIVAWAVAIAVTVVLGLVSLGTQLNVSQAKRDAQRSRRYAEQEVRDALDQLAGELERQWQTKGKSENKPHI